MSIFHPLHFKLVLKLKEASGAERVITEGSTYTRVGCFIVLRPESLY